MTDFQFKFYLLLLAGGLRSHVARDLALGNEVASKKAERCVQAIARECLDTQNAEQADYDPPQ